MIDIKSVSYCRYFLIVVSAVTLICFSTMTVCFGGDSKGNAVAIINGEEISRTELADFLIDSFGKEGMEILIRRVLVRQVAKKDNVVLAESEVTERVDKLVELELNKLKKRYGADNPDALKADLLKMGYDEDKLREKLVERVEVDVRPQLLAEKLVKKTITVTDEELREAYEEIYGEKYQVRQIVVSLKEDADKLLLQIKGGADFAKLANERSIDRPTAAKGGLMDPVNKVSALGKAISVLKKGDITDVIQSRNGFHIFLMAGVIPPAETKSYEDALPDLKKIVTAVNIKKRSGPWFLNLVESAKIKNYLE